MNAVETTRKLVKPGMPKKLSMAFLGMVMSISSGNVVRHSLIYTGGAVMMALPSIAQAQCFGGTIEEAKAEYEWDKTKYDQSVAEQDSEFIEYHKNILLDSKTLYATCLVQHSPYKSPDYYKGIEMLKDLAHNQNHIVASYALAEGLKTDSTYRSKDITRDNINEAIKAYQHTIDLINAHPSYPSLDYFFYEGGFQIELNSYTNIVELYSKKYFKGAIGNYSQALLRSPTYTGDRSLDRYTEYAPHTIQSLNNIITHSERCLNLPKKNHFNPERYQEAMDYCQKLNSDAKKLLSLEQEVLDIYNHPDCQNIKHCLDQVLDIFDKMN